MANILVGEELYEAVSQLIKERDTLLTSLDYATSTIQTLSSQNQELTRLLSSAQAALLAPQRKPSASSAPNKEKPGRALGTTWIGGTYLSHPPDDALLGHAEKAWASGRTQDALGFISNLLGSLSLPDVDAAKLELLQSAVLRSSGEVARGLTHAENALQRARRAQAHELAGRAQFHRGLCCFYLDRYADAAWCFALASSTTGYAEIVEVHRDMAEKKRARLPEGQEGRVVTEGFLKG